MSLREDLQRVAQEEHVLWNEARRRTVGFEELRHSKVRQATRVITDLVKSVHSAYKQMLDQATLSARDKCRQIEKDRDAEIAELRERQKIVADEAARVLEDAVAVAESEYESAKGTVEKWLAERMEPLRLKRKGLEDKMGKWGIPKARWAEQDTPRDVPTPTPEPGK